MNLTKMMLTFLFVIQIASCTVNKYESKSPANPLSPQTQKSAANEIAQSFVLPTAINGVLEIENNNHYLILKRGSLNKEFLMMSSLKKTDCISSESKSKNTNCLI